MRRPYLYEARFVVCAETLAEVRAHCSLSGRQVYLTPTLRLRVHTLRGVPGKVVDVLLPDQLPADPLVCEIGRKAGSFDGAIRWRIALRPWTAVHDETAGQGPCAGHPGEGRVSIEEEYGALTVVARWWGGGLWAQSFRQLPYKPEPGDRRGVLLHHWKSWYRFLPEEEARQLAEMWSLLPAVMEADDIVVLNRLASEALYDLARSLGWRKLTLRERRRLGLADDSQQWHRADSPLLRRPGGPSPTGCGRYTIEAASGAVPIRTAYGLEEVE